jgi:hypothetical protein
MIAKGFTPRKGVQVFAIMKMRTGVFAVWARDMNVISEIMFVGMQY